MGKITYQDINLIMNEFKLFISDNKKSTQNQYMDIVKEYLLNEVCNQVEEDEYKEIFSEEKIIDFQQNYRRSKVARSVLKKLKDYFIQVEKLPKYYDFEYVFWGKENKIDKELIALDDIRDIVLGDDTRFRSKEEKITTQCMSAISYYCLFEQRHIRTLKCSDVFLDERRIRNVRVDDKANGAGLVKWIHLGEEAVKYIVRYAEYFHIDFSKDELFFRMSNCEEFDNGCQNNLFANYNFKENGFLSVGSQQLNYSRIYHYLVATQGRGMVDIVQIVGFSNAQLKNALKNYLLDYGVIYNPNNIGELPSIADIEEKYEKAVNEYESAINSEEESIEDNGEWVTVCNGYLEENDIKMDDVILYDSMSENNQKTKDVELSRLVRSTYLAEDLKLAYNHTCQLCGTRLMKTRFEAYSEAHHIRPYNKTHKGDDTIGNMIVLCPNCHSQFDSLYYAIHPHTRFVHCVDETDKFHLTKMEFIGAHILEQKYLAYTWQLFKKR